MGDVINVLWVALLILSILWTGIQIRDRLKTRKNQDSEEETGDR